MEFIELLESIDMIATTKKYQSLTEEKSTSKRQGNHESPTVVAPPRATDHSFRNILCQTRLQTILDLQKLKRVNKLKEEMTKVEGRTLYYANSELSSSQHDTEGVKGDPSSSTQPTKKTDYPSNSISSYFNRTERCPSSPNNSFALVSGGGSFASTDGSMSYEDVDPIIDEEEMKQEERSQYRELVHQLEEMGTDLIDSSDEMKAASVSPVSHHPKGRSASRKVTEEKADVGDHLLGSDEEVNGTKIFKSPTTPKIRFAKRKQRSLLQSSSSSQQRANGIQIPRKQKPGSSYRSFIPLATFSDEGRFSDDESDASNESNEGISFLQSPSSSSFAAATAAENGNNSHRSHGLLLPLITEEIIWELRVPQSLIIADSKLFFFQNILWRLTFGRNNIVEDYYYFFISPAEKLKSFISLKIDFHLYPPAVNNSSVTTSATGGGGGFPSPPSSLTSPYVSSPIHPFPSYSSASLPPLVAPGMRSSQGYSRWFNSSLPERAETESQRIGMNKVSSGDDQQMTKQSLPPSGIYTKKASQNFTFPVEFTVSRGYEKFIRKEDLQQYLQIPATSSSPSLTAGNITSSSPTMNYPKNYSHLKLSVVISTNLGPNGELIGYLNR